MKKILCFVLIIPMLVCSAYADDGIGSFFDISGMYYELTEDELSVLGEADIRDTDRFTGAVEAIAKNLTDKIKDYISDDIKTAASIIFITVICACYSALSGGSGNEKIVNTAACAAVVLITAGGVDSIIRETGDTFIRLLDYSKAALPVVYTAAAAGGALGASAARYAGCCLVIDIMMNIVQQAVFPLIMAFIALGISEAVYQNSALTAASRLIKWFVTAALSVITIAFTSYLALAGVIAGSADAVAVKTTKTLISMSLPVVGGMISDAAAVVLSSAAIMRNSVGVFGLLSILIICIEPFAKILIRYLVFKFAAAVSDMASGTNLSSLMNSLGTGIGMLAGVIGAEAIMLFISFSAAVKAVTV